MELPSAFKERMERMLGTEYEEFLQSYEREQSRGLRLNLLKTDPETFLKKKPLFPSAGSLGKGGLLLWPG